MSNMKTLLDLQWTQLKHDESYHRDIIVLSLGDRIKHMALHMAKYTGYLASVEAQDGKRIGAVLTDAFIIALATANALNQDLARELGDASGSQTLRQTLNNVLAGNDALGDDELLRAFARHSGTLAKASESLDHVENHPFRTTMLESNLALFRTIIGAAAARQLDLDQAYATRLRAVEQRSIFDAHVQSSQRTYVS